MRILKLAHLSGLHALLFLYLTLHGPCPALAQPDYEGRLVEVPDSANPFNYRSTASYEYKPSEEKNRARIQPSSPAVQSRSLKRPVGLSDTDPTFGELGPTSRRVSDGPGLLRLLAREPATGSTREASSSASSAPESANPFNNRSGRSPENSRIYDASARVRVSVGVSAVPR